MRVRDYFSNSSIAFIWREKDGIGELENFRFIKSFLKHLSNSLINGISKKEQVIYYGKIISNR